MKKLVIIGQPLGHSLSPIMHNAALSSMCLDSEYHYEPLSISSDQLPGLVESVHNQTIAGANITIPYKSKIMSYLPLVKEESQVLGAVNTLYCEDDNVVGCNTDVFGFRESLKEHAVDVRRLRASIIGTGGAARAVAYTLAEDGVESIEILCRNQQKAELLASMLQRRFDMQVEIQCSLTAEYERLRTDLLVNCTPAGMFGHSIMETPLKASLLTENLVVMDLVYNPLKTKLLTEAEAAMCKTIGGIEMLVQQGAASLELWTGKKPPIDIMRKMVLEALGG